MRRCRTLFFLRDDRLERVSFPGCCLEDAALDGVELGTSAPRPDHAPRREERVLDRLADAGAQQLDAAGDQPLAEARDDQGRTIHRPRLADQPSAEIQLQGHGLRTN
jgi:hypothetical protein